MEETAQLYQLFTQMTMAQLEDALLSCRAREEKAFYRALLNLKLQIEQERVIDEVLL
mgnify:FL=1